VQSVCIAVPNCNAVRTSRLYARRLRQLPYAHSDRLAGSRSGSVTNEFQIIVNLVENRR
jgi:hypothetical protein